MGRGNKGGSTEKIAEIKAEIFLYFMKTIKLQIKEAQWTPSKNNIGKTIPRYMILKLLKTSNKEKILKATREKLNFM